MTETGGQAVLSESRIKPLSRGEQRRRAFLDAANDVFLEYGYEAASVNEVVRRAGGSLATLYSQFGNKDGLFWAMIEEATSTFSEALAESIEPVRPLEDGLQIVGEQYLQRILMPRSLALFRIIVGEAHKFPEMARRFFAKGPDQVRASVADYLVKRASIEGLNMTPAQAELDGAFFCDMVRARHHYRSLCDDEYKLSDADIRAHVKAVVSRFLNGVRAR